VRIENRIGNTGIVQQHAQRRRRNRFARSEQARQRHGSGIGEMPPRGLQEPVRRATERRHHGHHAMSLAHLSVDLQRGERQIHLTPQHGAAELEYGYRLVGHH
jgi:hypothetical protein